MQTTFLETQEDKTWIKDVFGIDMEAEGYVCAILVGNEDSPEKIEFFKENRNGRPPDFIWTPSRAKEYLVTQKKTYSVLVVARNETEASEKAFEIELGDWQEAETFVDVEEQ